MTDFPATDKQRAALARWHLPREWVSEPSLSKKEASDWMDELARARDEGREITKEMRANPPHARGRTAPPASRSFSPPSPPSQSARDSDTGGRVSGKPQTPEAASRADMGGVLPPAERSRADTGPAQPSSSGDFTAKFVIPLDEDPAGAKFELAYVRAETLADIRAAIPGMVATADEARKRARGE